MNRRLFSISLLALVAFVFAACKPKPIVDEKAVFAVIRENLTAMQNKDVPGVMATIHPECPAFASTKDQITDIFKNYQLRFTLSDLKIVSATPEEVKVSFVQRADMASSSETQSTVAQGVHTLRKDGGKWKIYDTNIVIAPTTPGAPGTVAPVTPAPAQSPASVTPTLTTPMPAVPAASTPTPAAATPAPANSTPPPPATVAPAASTPAPATATSAPATATPAPATPGPSPTTPATEPTPPAH